MPVLKLNKRDALALAIARMNLVVALNTMDLLLKLIERGELSETISD